MPTNQFKPFATAGDANVIDQATFEALLSTGALKTGFLSGVADSNKVNKVMRQASVAAWAIAQFIVDKAGVNANDDGNTAAFLANLKTAITNHTAPPAATTGVSGLTRLATVAENAALASQSIAATPYGIGQMFAKSLGESGFVKLPGGLILQWVAGGWEPADSSEPSQWLLWPTVFPNAAYFAIVGSETDVPSNSTDSWYQTTPPETGGITVQRQRYSGQFNAYTRPKVFSIGY